MFFYNQKRINIYEHIVKMVSHIFILFRIRTVIVKKSVKLPCVYVCLSFGDLIIFSVRASSFFSYFYVTYTSVFSLSILFRLCISFTLSHLSQNYFTYISIVVRFTSCVFFPVGLLSLTRHFQQVLQFLLSPGLGS